jgi:hypothetical protein
MNRIALLAILLLFAVILVACTQSEPTGDMIDPGDKIGDMVIIKHDMQGTENFADTYCYTPTEIGENEYEFECQAKEGDLVLFPLGWNADTIEELDAKWEKSTFEMTIDDRMVDLPKFGPTQHPCQRWPDRTCRVYGVAIENITAGTHTIIQKKTYEGENPSITHWLFTVSE